MKNLGRFLIALVGGALFCVLPTLVLPTLDLTVAFPHIQMPPEAVTYPITLFAEGSYFGSLFLANTFVPIIIADILVLIMGLAAGNAARKRMAQYQANPKAVDADGMDLMVPKGWHNTFEAIVEYMDDLISGIIDKRHVTPVFNVSVTIFLLVIVANYLHFLPITDAFGIMHCADESKGLEGFDAAEIGNTGLFRYTFAEDNRTFPEPASSTHEACEAAHHAEEGDDHAAAADSRFAKTVDDEAAEDLKYVLTPFVRTAATDLNMTLALAIVSIVFVQALGVRELGLGYFTKFFNLPALENGFVGWIELVVSWIEILSEIFKMVSLAFRLFGNIFAGAILLLVMAFLIPVGAPLVFWLLEVLIGAIQAFVFAMLTIVFVAVAQAGHGDHGDHDDDGEHH